METGDSETQDSWRKCRELLREDSFIRNEGCHLERMESREI